MTTLKYGLNIQKKPVLNSGRPAPGKRKPIFGDDASDNEETAEDANAAEEVGVFDADKSARPASELSKVAIDKPPPKLSSRKDKLPVSQYGDLSSRLTHQKHAAEATSVDPSVYDYDAAYDALHAKSAAKKASEREDAQLRKPKYMDHLLAAAEVRKRDQLRAKDKLLQKEREAEGDEFADKEKFVTSAYKEQEEEVRRLEEEEKKREEEQAANKKKLGMQGFYRSMMELEGRKHKELEEAAAQIVKPGDAVPIDSAPQERSEVELAKELNAKGGNIIINDEGQVADKRQLLSAGLNVVPKPKSASTAPSAASARTSGSQQAYQGVSSSKQAMRERQTRLLEAQLEQATKRAADDEEEERRRVEHAAKSRKTESDISGAKERYLQRKREAAAAAAAAKGAS
ncbi:putative nuclear speckle splicing regulatory protein 1 like protein [Cryomyces antarcticus]|nr:hypothetical protein LTR39_000952 [Cryomyces antarcticus]